MGTLKTILKIVFLILTIALTLIVLWMWLMYRSFSYNGKRQMSKQIIDGISRHIHIPDDGKCLDVGCGSGKWLVDLAEEGYGNCWGHTSKIPTDLRKVRPTTH